MSFPKIGWQFLRYFPTQGWHFPKKVNIFLNIVDTFLKRLTPRVHNLSISALVVLTFPEITSHQIIAQILKKYTFPKITLSHHKPLDLHPSTLDPKKRFFCVFWTCWQEIAVSCSTFADFCFFSRILRQNPSMKKIFRAIFLLYI